jgi:hypothetical protein
MHLEQGESSLSMMALWGHTCRHLMQILHFEKSMAGIFLPVFIKDSESLRSPSPDMFYPRQSRG